MKQVQSHFLENINFLGFVEWSHIFAENMTSPYK